mgnify:CR=1 FL=1
MLNALWAFMMLTGLGWAAVHGTLGAVTEGMLAAAGDAVSLGITMLGVMAFWTGILEIGRRAGLIEQLSAGMRPVLHFLFPRIPAGHPALSSMAANMIANMLGLGWAAYGDEGAGRTGGGTESGGGSGGGHTGNGER